MSLAGGLLILALLAPSSQEVVDLDAWHAERQPVEWPPSDSEAQPRLALGLYPVVGLVVGLPNLVAGAADAYISLTARDRISVFAGYGREWGGNADSESFTLGWGGVRDLPVASSQRGFHGTFVRYRRWAHDHHGLHHGVSAGVESGAGNLGFALEIGAARSDLDHWLATVRVTLKVPFPILVPLAW